MLHRAKFRILSNLRIVELSLSVPVCVRLNMNLTRLAGTSVRLSTHLFLTNRTPWYFESRLTDNSDVRNSGTTGEFQGERRRWVRIFVFELQEPLFPFFLPFLLSVLQSSEYPPPSSALPSREQGSSV